MQSAEPNCGKLYKSAKVQELNCAEKKGEGNLQIKRFKRHTKFKTEIGKINVYYLETHIHTHTHTHTHT